MNPVLFILMRTDLDSMGSGKAMAQAAHAGNALETHFETEPQAAFRVKAFHEWKRQTPQGFGTTIVLGGSMAQIETDVEWLRQTGYVAAIVHDPTYPLRDGSVTHLIPLDTCAYVFAPNKDDAYLRVVLDRYELHP